MVIHHLQFNVGTWWAYFIGYLMEGALDQGVLPHMVSIISSGRGWCPCHCSVTIVVSS